MAERGTYTYDYPRPAVTADAAVFAFSGGAGGAPGGGWELLLVERRNEPFRGRWALPGGFLEMDETAEACARRELREETGVHLPGRPFAFVGLFDAVGRDPRGRVLSAAYAVAAPKSECAVRAGDDAAAARWFPLAALPPLAFDHAAVVRAAAAAQHLPLP